MSRWMLVGTVMAAVAIGGGFWVTRTPEARPHPHEYSPLVPIDLTLAVAGDGGDSVVPWELLRRDFSGKSSEGEWIDIEEVVKRNRVTLLTYFAEWCANCLYEAPDLVAKYNEGHDQGLAIVARSEYSHPDVVAEYLEEFGIEYPVLVGSPNPKPDNEDLVRTTTGHFRLRKALRDPRKWGTPMNIVVVDGDLANASIVTGEFFPGHFDHAFRPVLEGAASHTDAMSTTDP